MQKPEKELRAKATYAQIVGKLRERILSGEFANGTRIPTEFEIAQRYHVSRGTVRQALSELAHEGLLERIQGSGTFVRYSAPTQEQPGLLSVQKSVGVILDEAGDELNIKILLGLEQAVKPRGYQLIFAFSENNAQIQTRNIARLRPITAGLVIFPISDTPFDHTIAQLKADDFPFVLVDRYLSELDSDYVVSDNRGGGYRATEHLVILGHTRIGFAYSHAGGILTTSVRDRWEGYRKALYEYNRSYDESLIFHHVFTSADQSSSIYEEILRRPDRPSAIFAVNDEVALNFIKAASKLGLRVPDDLAVVGFDNLSYAEHLSVPLTTIVQQGTEIGLHAGTLLINRIEGQVIGEPKHIELPTNLIVRQSCGARVHVLNRDNRSNITKNV